MWWLIVSVCAFWLGLKFDRSIKNDKQTMKDMNKCKKMDTLAATLDLDPVEPKKECSITFLMSKVLGLACVLYADLWIK